MIRVCTREFHHTLAQGHGTRITFDFRYRRQEFAGRDVSGVKLQGPARDQRSIGSIAALQCHAALAVETRDPPRLIENIGRHGQADRECTNHTNDQPASQKALLRVTAKKLHFKTDGAMQRSKLVQTASRRISRFHVLFDPQIPVSRPRRMSPHEKPGYGRFLWSALALGFAFCTPFLIWGNAFSGWFTGEGAITWIRSWGAWGWLAVLALLMSDLILPIPATPVMSATGYIYGPWVGGMISAMGSFLAGMLGYLLCRSFGEKPVAWLLKSDERARHAAVFPQLGPWLVAASRWLPLFPEVVSCMAGLTRMPWRIFALALACGSIPLGFTYAAIGASGRQFPRLALALSILLPLALWGVAQLFLRRQKKI